MKKKNQSVNVLNKVQQQRKLVFLIQKCIKLLPTLGEQIKFISKFTELKVITPEMEIDLFTNYHI